MDKKERRKTIKENSMIIDLLRRHSDSDKSELASISGVSWPTMDKIIKNIPSFDDEAMIDFGKGKSIIFHEFAQYLGISLEPTRIMASCVGLNFRQCKYSFFESRYSEMISEITKAGLGNDIDWNSIKDKNIEICVEHDETFSGISLAVEKVINLFLDLAEQFDFFKLIGIGIAIPGVIDFNSDEMIIRMSPNIRCLQSIPAQKIVRENCRNRIEDNGIFLSFEHDTQAAALTEIYSMSDEDYNKYVNNKTLGCIMADTGIGLAIVHNGEIIRGHGSFGELGHLQVSNIGNDDKNSQLPKCDCGKNNCLEISLRSGLLKSHTNYEFEENIKPEKLMETFSDGTYEYKSLRGYFGYIMNILGTLLNVDTIVFCGRLITNFEKLANDLEMIYFENVIGVPTASCKIITSENNQFYIATGAAISSYYACNEENSFPKIKL